MDGVLPLDPGHGHLGDEHQDDRLAQSADEREDGEGDDLQTQRAQAERPHDREQGVGRCVSGAGRPGPGERFLHWSRVRRQWTLLSGGSCSHTVVGAARKWGQIRRSAPTFWDTMSRRASTPEPDTSAALPAQHSWGKLQVRGAGMMAGAQRRRDRPDEGRPGRCPGWGIEAIRSHRAMTAPPRGQLRDREDRRPPRVDPTVRSRRRSSARSRPFGSIARLPRQHGRRRSRRRAPPPPVTGCWTTRRDRQTWFRTPWPSAIPPATTRLRPRQRIAPSAADVRRYLVRRG